MAVPVMGTSAVQAGIATAVVAYGYVLSGTAVTSCANSIATATLTSSKTFIGAAYQTMTVTMTPYAALTAATATLSARAKVGNENYDAIAVKASATLSPFVTTTSDGLATSSTSATNHYWDFM